MALVAMPTAVLDEKFVLSTSRRRLPVPEVSVIAWIPPTPEPLIVEF